MKKTKGIKKTKNTRSALRVEALESRQLLAGISGGGTAVENAQNVVLSGLTYDQVLMTGSSVTVTPDQAQIVRVSFLDLSGDIVQAEFSGAGTLTVSMDAAGFLTGQTPANYNQTGVSYVKGLASFTIQGSDATTNFNVFSVGSGNATNSALFDSTHTGGNNLADVARLTIVANPANPNGSAFNSIYAGNAVFSASSGVVGITAANVQVQNLVRIGDINATGTATPSLTFGELSQFAAVEVTGGDLVQANGKAINNTGSNYSVSLIAGATSAGAALPAQTTQSQIAWTGDSPFQAQQKAFTLTTNPDVFTGTGEADTYSGYINTSAGSSNSTLTGADQLNGAGGTDTLNLVVDGTGTGSVPGANVQAIENFYIRDVATGGASAYDFGSITGEAQVWSDRSTNAVTFSNLGTGTAAGLNGDGSTVLGNLTFGMATNGNALTLNVANGVGATGTAPTVTNTTSTATSATINSTGAANILGTVSLNAAAALTSVTINATTNLKADLLSQATDDVAANGAVTISGAASKVEFTTALDNTIKTLDASGLTAGGIIATVGTGTETVKGGAGADTVTLSTGVKTATFGAGNDTVTTAAVNTTTAGAVDGGDGTDILNIAAATDVNSAAKRAVYTGFETLRNSSGASIAADGFAGITAVQVNGNANSITALNATQAGNVSTLANSANVTLALSDASGTSDVLKVTSANSTAGNAASLTNATIDGFETLNFVANTGNADPTNGQANDLSFFSAADLTTLTISGTKGVDLVLDNTAKAVTVSSNQTAGAIRLEGEVVKGSSITTTGNVDTIETALATVAGVAGEFVTYNAGGGNDTITTSLTALNNTNNAAASLKIEGGAGTDTLKFQTTDTTFVDAHFQYTTGIEKLTIQSNTSVSMTTGGFFDTNYKASGVEVTAASVANNSTATLNLSSFTGAAKVALTTAADGASTADNVNVTTGLGADDVTVTASSWLGTGGTASLSVTTGVGNDKVAVTTGTLANDAATVTINAGTGADTISVTHTNGNAAGTNFTYVVADGDSAPGAADKITGFQLGGAATVADTLNLQGTPTVAANTAGTNGTDSGSIKAHAISSGIVTFDDVDTFAGAIVISESNLSSVLGYLQSNITTSGETVAFAYDSDADGVNDSTYVFQQGANDTLILLDGVVGTSVATANSTTAGLINIG